MASTEIKPEDIADWFTPRQAVQTLESVFGTDSHSYVATHTLLERLRGGIIRAVAGTADLYPIPADDWTNVNLGDFLWTTGDATFKIAEGSGYNLSYKTVRHYSIRIDPNGVRDMLPDAPQHAIATSAQAANEPEQKGPPVSDAHLKAWYEIYQQAYTGAADTEANAIASARGMFPGKSVSRDRVRELRGAQKRGPKGPRNSGDDPRN